MRHCSAIKMKIHTATWIKLGNIIESERNRFEKLCLAIPCPATDWNRRILTEWITVNRPGEAGERKWVLIGRLFLGVMTIV